MEPATDLAMFAVPNEVNSGNGPGVKMFLFFGGSPEVAENCKTGMADSN